MLDASACTAASEGQQCPSLFAMHIVADCRGLLFGLGLWGLVFGAAMTMDRAIRDRPERLD